MRIEISGFTVTLERKRVKNINLRIKRNGEVQISAPIKTPIEVINRFLYHKRPWIERHRYRLLQREKETFQKFSPGDWIDFQGSQYVIQLHETNRDQRIEFNDHQFNFFVKPNASHADKENMLMDWYRAQMEKSIPSLFDKWQSIMKVSVNQIHIKRMRSRWGSCHPVKKNITLNLRLIEKPMICLEYVIVHELVHLFEPSHNQRFYKFMDGYLPNWREIKKQLA